MICESRCLLSSRPDGSAVPAVTLAKVLITVMPLHFCANGILGTTSQVQVKCFHEVAFTRGDAAPAAQIWSEGVGRNLGGCRIEGQSSLEEQSAAKDAGTSSPTPQASQGLAGQVC